MTRPIQEPTTQRSVRGLGFSADQLFRRPAPASDGGVLELVAVNGPGTITVPDDTWTLISAVNWSGTYEQGDGNHIHVNTAVSPDRIQIYHDAVFTFSGCVEWASPFTATRALRIGPSGDYFPEGGGKNEIDLGEEGNNNTFGTTFMSNFGSGGDPQVMTIEAWQDSGGPQDVTGDTSFLLVLLGLIEP